MTHGQSGTPLYLVWIEMRQRCMNPDHRNFHHYGGRGITICGEWSDFEVFQKWALANCYEEGLSLDRIDNDGNYGPENCRWVTQAVQANNTRRSRMLTYKGRTQSMRDWADEFDINYHTLRSRLRIGWSVKRALETPMRGNRSA